MKVGGPSNTPSVGGIEDIPKGRDKTPGSGIGGGGGGVPEAGNGGGQSFSVGKDTKPGELTQLQDKLANALGEGDLQKAGDAIAQFLASIGDKDVLAKLLIEFAAMGRQQALDNRLQAREIAQAQLMGQAGETREAATKMMIGAIVSAAISMVAAAVSIGGGMSQLSKASSAFQSAQKATQLGNSANQASNFAQGAQGAAKTGADKISTGFQQMSKEASTKAEFVNRMADAQNQIVSGVSGLINALAQGFKGAMDSSAKLDEAQGMELAAAAQMEQSNADLAKKVMDELEEMIRATMQFIKEMKNAEAELMSSMTRV